MSRKTVLVILTICVVSALILSGCGGARTGGIEGTMTGAESGAPIANAQVILCKGTAEESGCVLLADPTTTTDSEGNFSFNGLEPGSYLLLYGMPGELTASPEDWGGVVVGQTKVDLDEDGKFVQTGEGDFWADGWENVGEQMTDAAGKTIYTDGYAQSIRFGISMMVVDRERAPILAVQPRETTEINWVVLER
jgi:hypothetical protein